MSATTETTTPATMNNSASNESFDIDLTCIRPFFPDPIEYERLFNKVRYIALVPAVLMIILLMFLQRRKRLATGCFGGRPGVAVPLNLIEDQTDRVTLVSAFGITMWGLIAIIVAGELPYNWSYDKILHAIMLMAGCVLIAILNYALFAPTTMKDPTGYVFGSLFVWFYTAVFVFEMLPCSNHSIGTQAMHFLQLAPALVFLFFLSVGLPWRAVMQCCSDKKSTSFWSTAEDIESFNAKHVRSVLSPSSKTAANERMLLQNMQSRFYAPYPGFRYSLNMLVAVTISIQFIYTLSLFAVQMIWLTMDIVEPMLQRAETNVEMAQFIANLFGMDVDVLMGALGEINFWVRTVVTCLYVGIGVAFVLVSLSMLFTLKSYRKHLLFLFKGIHKGIPKFGIKWKPRAVVVASAKYVGFQFGYAVWGFAIQTLAIILITLGTATFGIVVIKYGQYMIVLRLIVKAGPTVAYLVLILVVQNLLVNFVFLQKDVHGNRVIALDNRRLFFNFQYLMVFTNAPLGFIACLVRIVKALVFGLWVLPRLDMSTLSRQFERFDNGFVAYIALLTVENAQRNPTMRVFVNLLTESLTVKYKRAGSRIVGTDRKDVERRRRLARNRWMLAYTLHKNPTLRQQRYDAKKGSTVYDSLLVPRIDLDRQPMQSGYYIDVQIGARKKQFENGAFYSDSEL